MSWFHRIMVTVLIISLGLKVGWSQTDLISFFDDRYQPYCSVPLSELNSATVSQKLQDLGNRFPTTFSYSQIGISVEGRPIYLVEWGSGTMSVLMWSQMHGDEPTATAALLDIFNFLLTNADDSLVQVLYRNLKILAVPLLNPDGAAAHSRRNAQGLDINRDARDLSTPEGRILYALKERYRPSFGFNLHDQNGRITTARTNKQVALALMAPPFDYEDSDNETRLRAKQLVVWLTQRLAPVCGEHIARYSDEYMPRAFGDAMQSWGVSTILIEAGGWPQQRDQFQKRLNFIAILTALTAIATQAYQQVDAEDYYTLPLNDKELFDLVISDVMVVDGTGIPPFKADVGINFQIENGDTLGTIVDIGDLNDFYALKTIKGEGLYLMPGLLAVIPERSHAQELSNLLAAGFTTVLVATTPQKTKSWDQLVKSIQDIPFAGNIGVVIEQNRHWRTAADSLQILQALSRYALGVVAKDTTYRGFRLAAWLGKPAVVLTPQERRKRLSTPTPAEIKSLSSTRYEQWQINRRGKIRPGQVADCVLFEVSPTNQIKIDRVLVGGRVVYAVAGKEKVSSHKARWIFK